MLIGHYLSGVVITWGCSAHLEITRKTAGWVTCLVTAGWFFVISRQNSFVSISQWSWPVVSATSAQRGMLLPHTRRKSAQEHTETGPHAVDLKWQRALCSSLRDSLRSPSLGVFWHCRYCRGLSRSYCPGQDLDLSGAISANVWWHIVWNDNHFSRRLLWKCKKMIPTGDK